MPDFGALNIETLADRPAVSGGDGWELADATVVSLTFELRKAQAVPFLPSALIRPVPPYGKIIVVDAPDSPAGPYREAMLFVGAREGMQIRNVLVDSIVTTSSALAAAREQFGGSRRPGSIDLRLGDEEVLALIGDDDGQLGEVRMGALRRCDATMLKFDALLVPGTVDGKAELLRWGLRVPLTEVEGTLSRDWEVRMARRDTAWSRLSPAYNVTGFFARGPARIEAAHVPEVTRR